MKHGRTYLVGLLVFLLLVGGAGFGGYRYLDSEVHAAQRSGQGSVSVDIPPGSSVTDIANLLANRGVIASALVFEAYVRVKGLGANLQAGHYAVPGGLSMVQVIALLEHNQSGSEVSVTLPEALTSGQQAALFAAKGVFSAAAYTAEVKTGVFPEDFLADHYPAAGIEGFLFPDTYFLSPGVKPHDVIELQLKRFGEQVPASLRAHAADNKLTFYQALVLSTIVERESRFDEDRANIASVFYNRLRAGMPLQSDITVLFAKGLTNGSISEDDKKIDSPYNTYLHTGLPPGPICNPGLPSIRAALFPATTTYLYFLADHQGHAHFARTLAEHQANQVKYGVS